MKYIIDVNTKNKSFIRMYKVLKKKGITNNKFFLRLYDPGLSGVDPYDKNLSQEMQARILTEVVRNVWYFLREVVRIPVPGGSKSYELHRGNLALTFCMVNDLHCIEVLPRQHGKTISTECVYNWLYNFNCENANFLFLNKEFQDSKLNLKRFKDINDLLPEYLKFSSRYDTDNIEYMASDKNGNTIRALSAAHSEDDADKKGRGNTSPIMWWDEFAFLKYNNIMYGSSSPAAAQAILESRNKGKHYGKVITTTPNNIDKKEGSFCKKMIDEAAIFTEEFYNWSKDKIDEYINKNSNNDFVYIEFSYKELGRDEKWFEEQKRALNNDMLLIKREILLEWTRSSEASVFSEEQLDKIYNQIRQPIGDIILLGAYRIQFYKHIDFNKTWIIGVDPSNAVEKDATAITIFDPFTFEVIGEFRNNKIDTDDIKKLIFELVSMYLRNSIVAIENNIGKHILDSLMKTSIEKNLYYEYRDVLAQKIEESMTEIQYTKNKKKVKVYGVNTNTYSRPKMIETLMYIVENEPENIATKYLYSDCKDMERDKRGKVQHREGGHDDSIFSYLIGRYMLSDGTNLKKFRITASDQHITTEDRHNNITKTNQFITSINQDKIKIYDMFNEIATDKDMTKNISRRSAFFNSLINDNEDDKKIKMNDIWL